MPQELIATADSAVGDDEEGVYDVPDRITGRETVAELRGIHPEREWRFVEIDITYNVSRSDDVVVCDADDGEIGSTRHESQSDELDATE